MHHDIMLFLQISQIQAVDLEIGKNLKSISRFAILPEGEPA
jgi:hypothetical protein